MNKNTIRCVAVAGVSLVAASVCHRFFPGLGLVLKPLLWPLLVLPLAVPARAAAVTACAVPLLSASVNGMPTWPVACALSATALAAVGLVAVARLVLRGRRTAARA